MSDVLPHDLHRHVATHLIAATADYIGEHMRPFLQFHDRNHIGKSSLKRWVVSLVGYAKADQSLEERVMTGLGRAHRRKLLSTLATGLKMAEWPEWLRVALEAARLAPSAINRQPWSFHVEPGNITVSVRSTGPEFGISKRLDCGIAMLHIEVAAMTLWRASTVGFL